MALVFPNNPTVGQTYQSGSSFTYEWNGDYWNKTEMPTDIQLNTDYALEANTALSASFVNNSTTTQYASKLNKTYSGVTNIISANASSPSDYPTKANNPIFDYLHIEQNGIWATLSMGYAHTDSTGASSGIGDYLFILPVGYRFSSVYYSFDTNPSFLSGAENVHKIITNATGLVSANADMDRLVKVVPYSVSAFRIISFSPSNFNYVRSRYYNMGSTNRRYEVTFKYRLF